MFGAIWGVAKWINCFIISIVVSIAAYIWIGPQVPERLGSAVLCGAVAGAISIFVAALFEQILDFWRHATKKRSPSRAGPSSKWPDIRTIAAGSVMLFGSFFLTLYLTEPERNNANEPKKTNSICNQNGPVTLVPPFSKQGAFAFVAHVPEYEATADTIGAPAQSTLVLCEGDKPLGPAHTSHQEIRDKGMGRFSHWDGDVVFSASDNSDPNRNGRVYTVVIPSN